MRVFLPILALLQSNDTIAQAVERAVKGLEGLTVNQSSYTDVTNFFTMLTGWFALTFLWLIQFWAGLTHSYGFAIILTAISIRIMLMATTRMQIRSMKVMQYLQPVQREITRYYPNKQDQNAKMMELYSEYKINPLSGCLPLIVQMPILIGVYRALYDPVFAGHSFIGMQLLFPVSLTSARNMGHGPEMSEIIDVTVRTLGLQHQIWSIPTNIPLIGGSFIYLPALILVLLYAGSSVLLQRTMKKVNQPHPEFEAEFKAEMKTKGDQPQPPDMAAQMQRQMGIMNVMILFIAFFFSAGALIYFVIQNILMTLEYTFLSKGAEPAFSAAEMKAFIRRPPPPSRVPGVGAAKPEPGRNGKVDDAEVSKTQGDLPEQVEAAQNADPQRPRRKRRKR